MMEIPKYYIEEREPLVVYNKWRTRTGPGINVLPLEFKGYIKSGKGNRYLIQDKYEGQRWVCQIEDGSRKTFVSLVEVHPLDIEKVNLTTKDTRDLHKNYLLDRNSEDNINLELLEKEKEDIKTHATLEWINSNESRALLNFQKYPSDITLKLWNKIKTGEIKKKINRVKSSYLFNIWYFFNY